MILNLLFTGAHGIVNGGFRVIQGGRFEHGFMSGFFASLSASGVGMIKTAPLGLYAIVGAATGGTAEALGGGKFANGAVTGAFVGMFNHGMHGEKDGRLEFDNRDDAYSKIEELQKHMSTELAGYHLSRTTEDGSIEDLYIVDTASGISSTQSSVNIGRVLKYVRTGYRLKGIFHVHPSNPYGSTSDINTLFNWGSNMNGVGFYSDVICNGSVSRYNYSTVVSQHGNITRMFQINGIGVKKGQNTYKPNYRFKY